MVEDIGDRQQVLLFCGLNSGLRNKDTAWKCVLAAVNEVRGQAVGQNCGCYQKETVWP